MILTWEIDSSMHILDEVTLVLGGSVDWRTSSGLGLAAATGGSVGTTEDSAKGGNGKLDRNGEVSVSFFIFVAPTSTTKWSQKGMAMRPRPEGLGRGSNTYDVRADLLAGDLVVDDHLDGVGWGEELEDIRVR